jgi:hypothetical protein
VAFVSRKLSDVLHGREVEVSRPPLLQLLCSHVAKVRTLVDLMGTMLMTHILRMDAPDQSKMPQPDISFIVGGEILFLSL